MPLIAELKRAISLDERSQSAIAAKANVHPVRLSAFLNNRGKLGVDLCERLAQTMNYEIRLVRRTGKGSQADPGELPAGERDKLRKALARALELLGDE